MAPSRYKRPMEHLAVICGKYPNAVLRRAKRARVDTAQVSGQWAHVLQRMGGMPIQRPADVLALSNGTWVSAEEVGEDGIRARLVALDPSEPVTILSVIN